MNPFIQNVARIDVLKGDHKDPGKNSVLIQIADPAYGFPKPKHEFKSIHQFEFLDEDDPDHPDFGEFTITEEQAEAIASILNKAMFDNSNVIVHCFAGICRSGAVAEAGIMIGFKDTGTYREPNTLVKTRLRKALGLTHSWEE